MEEKKIQFLAYYLPQYHSIPENDEWWGEGFTEWTNVTKARPLFKGHEQPKLPSGLGFYDLRVPVIQEKQSELALKYGINGFIYYQYWFGNGKMLLEKPAEQMLENKNIKIPFCFCWANETWMGKWHGLREDEILIEQEYRGAQDYEEYFNYLLPFFKDERYIKVDNKPMFHIYRIGDIPDLEVFLSVFKNLANKNGFDGICFICADNSADGSLMERPDIYGEVGLDVFAKMRYDFNSYYQDQNILGKFRIKLNNLLKNAIQKGDIDKPRIYDYAKGVEKLNVSFPHEKYIPCVFPNWDNSPRSGNKSLIFKNSDPEIWFEYLNKVTKRLSDSSSNPPFLIIKSWNEWAEGNHLEPDIKYGKRWLEKVRDVKRINSIC